VCNQRRKLLDAAVDARKNASDSSRVQSDWIGDRASISRERIQIAKNEQRNSGLAVGSNASRLIF
jgi:hypothetical protein